MADGAALSSGDVHAGLTLYHCVGARSLRALWTLSELGLTEGEDFTLVTLPFPPRTKSPEFIDMNILGTIPYLVHGNVKMTESCAMTLYLVDRFGCPPAPSLRVRQEENSYGEFLNWIFHADATLTFPQTIFLRYVRDEPEKGLQQAGVEYAKWFVARLRLLDAALSDGREFLCGGRFTVADVNIAYALSLGRTLGFEERYKAPTRAYLGRMLARPGFVACGEKMQPPP